MQLIAKVEARRTYKEQLRKWLGSQGVSMSTGPVWPIDFIRPQIFTSAFLQHFQQSSHLKPGLWATFLPMSTEPPVDVFCQTKGVLRWAFPRVQGAELQMRHTHLSRQNFELSNLGVWEPKVECSTLVLKHQLTGIFLPGLGFDRNGQRMGRGGGFYDRYLEDFAGRRIAVAYSCQVSESPLTTEVHDQKVDEIWTERERLIC